MSIFNFTEDDLRANQSGLLSPCQKEWLQATARSARHSERRDKLFMAGVVFLILCGILGLVLHDASSGTVLSSNPGSLVIILAALFIMVSVTALMIFLRYHDVNRLEDAILSFVSGVVRLGEASSFEDNITFYYVIVGTEKFVFGDDMSSVFKEGERYKVYYCASGVYKRVMSYEQLH